ncbi:potassium/proton antiporter [Parvularcula oceani]|uniref:potassium/proton antiporter n=1 Tax=Parvularcula oceani TaxID=1247963 RepID=UPI00068F22AE|nr:potassium/proton antiporter [Parvularcula oceani]
MDVGIVILAASALSVGAILAGAAGQKIGAPILLVFLLAGMLAGREGPGGISVDASRAVLVWGSAALAVILFEGGLRTPQSVFRLGARPGLSLALLGTLVTALLVAPFARFAFGLEWPAALLLGAVVSSTDAAAVFALAATGLRMPKRVAAALEVESGFNDPLAILLVVGLSVSLATEPMGAMGWGGTLLVKLGFGAIVGLGVGVLVPKVLRRVELPQGLTSILTAGFGFIAFGLAETVGGSGFLAIYLAGLTIAAAAPEEAERVGSVMDGLAWLAQTGLFLLLGLLVTPSHLATLALPAAGAALALIFLARPLAVLLALSPFGFAMKEIGFIAWVGLRGATPVYLGLLPAALGVPNGNLYLSAAAVVVLLSLLIQGWTAPIVGHGLGVVEGEEGPPGRGAAIARLGAVAASIGVGAWFAVVLAPMALPTVFVPETEEELRDALKEETVVAGAFPPGFSARPVEERQPLFAGTVAEVVEAANDRVRADREELQALAARVEARGRLTLEEEAELSALARRYGLRFAPPETLLQRIDIVPPRLAAAQGALATGWGGAEGAVSRNAVFGRNVEEGYPNLVSAAFDLIRLYASHDAFSAFREARASARAQGLEPQAGPLIALTGPYADDGEAYIASLRAVADSPALREAPPAPAD